LGGAGGKPHAHWARPLLGADVGCRLVGGGPDKKDPRLIHDERLPKAERANGGGDGINGSVVEARVILIGSDAAQRTHFYMHVSTPVIALGHSLRPACRRLGQWPRRRLSGSECARHRACPRASVSPVPWKPNYFQEFFPDLINNKRQGRRFVPRPELDQRLDAFLSNSFFQSGSFAPLLPAALKRSEISHGQASL